MTVHNILTDNDAGDCRGRVVSVTLGFDVLGGAQPCQIAISFSAAAAVMALSAAAAAAACRS
jgi:hypothetical protein